MEDLVGRLENETLIFDFADFRTGLKEAQPKKLPMQIYKASEPGKPLQYPEFNPRTQPYIGQKVHVEEGDGIVKLIVTINGVDGVAAIELNGSREPVVKDYSLRPEA